MQFLKTIGLLLIACVLAVAAYIIYEIAPHLAPASISVVTNFEECAAAGNPVMESYPRQCNTPDGQHFVEEIGEQPWLSEETPGNQCAVAGCSQQLCVSAADAATIVTTCEFRNEYACYVGATCEMQPSGECGWTSTPELEQCLKSPPAVEGEFEGDLQVM